MFRRLPSLTSSKSDSQLVDRERGGLSPTSPSVMSKATRFMSGGRSPARDGRESQVSEGGTSSFGTGSWGLGRESQVSTNDSLPRISTRDSLPPMAENPFYDRIHGAKMMAALDKLAREVTSSNMSIRDVFADFDLDGDGTLDRQEMKIGVANLGVSISMWELDAIIGAFDDNNNGSIDPEEFVEMLEAHAKVPEAPKKGLLSRSASAVSGLLSRSNSKGPASLSEQPALQRVGSSPGLTSKFPPVKDASAGEKVLQRVGSSPGLVSKKSSRPGTPDRVGRHESSPLLVTGTQSCPLQARAGNEIPLTERQLPPWVKSDSIKGKGDLWWIESIMDNAWKPRLRRAFDKCVATMYDSRQSVWSIFKDMDLDGDKLVRKDEIAIGLRKLRVPLLTTELDSFLAMVIKGDAGGFTYREFSAFLARYARLISPLPSHLNVDAIKTHSDMEWIETVLASISTKLRFTLDLLAHEVCVSSRSINSFFVQTDTNGDGVLNVEELHAGITKVAGPVKLADIELLMRVFDSDRNGKIDYREFCLMLARYGRLTVPLCKW